MGEENRRTRAPAPFTSYGEFTGLVVSTTNDPATPYQTKYLLDLTLPPQGARC